MRNHCMSSVGRECRPLLAMSVGANHCLTFALWTIVSVACRSVVGAATPKDSLSHCHYHCECHPHYHCHYHYHCHCNCHGPSWSSHRRFCTDLDWSWTWASVSGCSREMCKSSEERAEHERPFYRKKCHQKEDKRKETWGSSVELLFMPCRRRKSWSKLQDLNPTLCRGQGYAFLQTRWSEKIASSFQAQVQNPLSALGAGGENDALRNSMSRYVKDVGVLEAVPNTWPQTTRTWIWPALLLGMSENQGNLFRNQVSSSLSLWNIVVSGALHSNYNTRSRQQWRCKAHGYPAMHRFQQAERNSWQLL